MAKANDDGAVTEHGQPADDVVAPLRPDAHVQPVGPTPSDRHDGEIAGVAVAAKSVARTRTSKMLVHRPLRPHRAHRYALRRLRP
jgi:hypothetical protein